MRENINKQHTSDWKEYQIGREVDSNKIISPWLIDDGFRK